MWSRLLLTTELLACLWLHIRILDVVVDLCLLSPLAFTALAG